jgi:hypothetical protein
MKVVAIKDHPLFANEADKDGTAILQGFIPARNDLETMSTGDNDVTSSA